MRDRWLGAVIVVCPGIVTSEAFVLGATKADDRGIPPASVALVPVPAASIIAPPSPPRAAAIAQAAVDTTRSHPTARSSRALRLDAAAAYRDIDGSVGGCSRVHALGDVERLAYDRRILKRYARLMNAVT